jgi:hypothetical protein
MSRRGQRRTRRRDARRPSRAGAGGTRQRQRAGPAVETASSRNVTAGTVHFPYGSNIRAPRPQRAVSLRFGSEVQALLSCEGRGQGREGAGQSGGGGGGSTRRTGRAGRDPGAESADASAVACDHIARLCAARAIAAQGRRGLKERTDRGRHGRHAAKRNASHRRNNVSRRHASQDSGDGAFRFQEAIASSIHRKQIRWVGASLGKELLLCNG